MKKQVEETSGGWEEVGWTRKGERQKMVLKDKDGEREREPREWKEYRLNDWGKKGDKTTTKKFIIKVKLMQW